MALEDRVRWLVVPVGLVLAGCSGADPYEEPTDDLELHFKSACAPATVVEGIDIASYQHPNGASINWSAVAQSERFVIVKATEGTGYTNPYYADDVQQARAAGLVAGAYHYLRYTSSGTAQADHFLSKVDLQPGDLPPMLDVEDTTGGTPATRTQTMRDWLNRVEQVTGRKPMIYSGVWYWGPYLGTPLGFDANPLAWAAYTTSSCPQIPDDFSKLTIWQYLGGMGSTNGINAACDQDKFYGSQLDLLALANGGADYRGDPIGIDGQSYPIVAQGAVTVHVGETVTGWVKLKNSGKATWKPGTVYLAPIPRDQASPFESPSWLNDHRISTVTQDVPPGALGQFALDITGRDLGETILSLGWVAEGITWFADAPSGGGPKDGYFAVKVNVVPAVGAGGSGGSSGDSAGGSAGDWGGAGAGWGGMGASAGSGWGTGGSAALEATLVDTDDGCSCRLASDRNTPSVALLALAGLALAFQRRRRARERAEATDVSET